MPEAATVPAAMIDTGGGATSRSARSGHAISDLFLVWVLLGGRAVATFHPDGRVRTIAPLRPLGTGGQG